MKINELSRITNIHPETIRMYRQKGFLHPQKQENGYYDYTMEDYISLIYLRKLREFDLSLEEAYTYENCSDRAQLLSILDQQKEAIDHQIELLKLKKRYIDIEKRHIQESFDTTEEDIRLMQSIDDKIDLYDLHTWFGIPEDTTSFYLTSTPTIRISRNILNGPITDTVIPLEVGVGAYRYMLEKRKISIPEHVTIISNGICISQNITLQDFKTISIQQLSPMMSYSKKIKRPFLSDTTGYLIRIRYVNDKPVYDFRIRACIMMNDRKDPDTN